MGQPFSQKARTWHRKSVMRPPLFRKGRPVYRHREERKRQESPVEMLVTTISLKKHNSCALAGVQWTRDTCNFIPPHLLSFSRYRTNISTFFVTCTIAGPPRKGEEENKRWSRWKEREKKKIRRAYFKQPLRERCTMEQPRKSPLKLRGAVPVDTVADV